MKRFMICGALTGLMTLFPAHGLAQQEEGTPPPPPAPKPAADVLTVVPGEAWGVVCVRNAAGLEKKMMTLVRRLNVPFIPPNMSLLMMAKAQLGLLTGINDNGGLAMAMMPVTDMASFTNNLVLFIPTTGFSDLVALMEPEEVEGGVSKVMFRGKESYAAAKGDYAVFAPSAEVLKLVLASKTNVRSQLSEHQGRHYATEDLTVWVNAKAITSSEMFTQLAPLLQQFNVDDEMLRSFQTVQGSVQLGQPGIGMSFFVAMDPASEMGKAMVSSGDTTGSHLNGLPKEKYVLALGSTMTKGQAQQGAQQLEKALGNIPLPPMINAERFAEVRKIAGEMFGSLRRLAFSISALPEGPQGLVGMAKVAEVDGKAAALLGRFGELIGIAKGGLLFDGAGKPIDAAYCEALAAVAGVEEEAAGEAEGTGEAEGGGEGEAGGEGQATPDEIGQIACMVMNLIEYQPSAETISGISVDRLAVRLDGIPDLDEEARGLLSKVLGADGFLFRMGAVDDKHIAATFGGGAERFTKVVGLVKANQAPLSDDAGIARSTASLPKSKYSEFYLAVDSAAALIDTLKKIADGEGLPFEVPEVNAPIAVVQSMPAPACSQTEVLIPMELITAIKDIGMAMTGMNQMGGPAPGGAGGPGERSFER